MPELDVEKNGPFLILSSFLGLFKIILDLVLSPLHSAVLVACYLDSYIIIVGVYGALTTNREWTCSITELHYKYTWVYFKGGGVAHLETWLLP